MVIKVKLFKNNQFVSIPLDEFVNEYGKEAPEGWFEYIEEWVNEGMNISSDLDYENYLKKMNLKWFDFKSVKTLYQSLTKSKYSEILDDDILRYLAHIYGLGYFKRTNYEMDIYKPDLDKFLDSKNVFMSIHDRSQLQENQKYSFNDLLTLKFGMNIIRKELIFSSKW